MKEMISELGIGHMATGSDDLYPELVRQFMATVKVYYVNGRAKRANKGTLTFFIRGIRHMITLPTLCNIYGFEYRDNIYSTVPSFPGQSAS